MAHSILDVARELIDSPAAKAAYADDPAGFMATRGLDHLSDAEIEEALGFVAEAMPAPVARQLVAPPGPVTDSLPLARVAAATAEVAVIEAERGTVDLADLVDPSGRLDLSTDIGGADADEPAPRDAATDVETEVEEEAVTDLADDAMLSDGATETGDAEFGTGAGDDGAQPRLIPHEGDEPDDTGLDDGVHATLEPPRDLDDDAESPPLDVVDASGDVAEPPDDDFDDVVI